MPRNTRFQDTIFFGKQEQESLYDRTYFSEKVGVFWKGWDISFFFFFFFGEIVTNHHWLLKGKRISILMQQIKLHIFTFLSLFLS